MHVTNNDDLPEDDLEESSSETHVGIMQNRRGGGIL